jgi:hypothetical protein
VPMTGSTIDKGYLMINNFHTYIIKEVILPANGDSELSKNSNTI